ncbi:DUF1269 domain-containing protein [Actinosynnema sp. NPDC047251]|uniref:Membrane protein n=1 Tax=Saccharothrix espanaensis (strain ATCC 51144 / DSM 44229 / JCM 9112 / NBRC 15066 / NRRL 15764) TaxID=1179773 RepID=K0K4E1_SACES|nr:DUF1269 domain-containing protein [Saccharothrix espanaensis]CCH33161.1 membrane protein [Saccharothrix espanaensis DSM 44229]
MATLTVWKFDTAEGARKALALLESLAKQELITIQDAAYVYWEDGAKRPKTKEVGRFTGAGALGGAFWGLLFGLLFLVPLLGAAVGAGIGAAAGSLAKVGIDDDFVRRVREKVSPGTSALFVLSTGAVVDRVLAEFRGTGAELISTNLSGDQEELLREAFVDTSGR